MGKASRLRKTSATKLSLQEFHSSLVQGKQSAGIIPHVPINFSVLDDIKSEDEDFGSTRVEEVCRLQPRHNEVLLNPHISVNKPCEDEELSAIQTASGLDVESSPVSSIREGGREEEDAQKYQERQNEVYLALQSPALAKVAARLDRLKALCQEITPEEKNKELQAIEVEFLAIEQDEKRKKELMSLNNTAAAEVPKTVLELTKDQHSQLGDEVSTINSVFTLVPQPGVSCNGDNSSLCNMEAPSAFPNEEKDLLVHLPSSSLPSITADRENDAKEEDSSEIKCWDALGLGGNFPARKEEKTKDFDVRNDDGAFSVMSKAAMPSERVELAFNASREEAPELDREVPAEHLPRKERLEFELWDKGGSLLAVSRVDRQEAGHGPTDTPLESICAVGQSSCSEIYKVSGPTLDLSSEITPFPASKPVFKTTKKDGLHSVNPGAIGQTLQNEYRGSTGSTFDLAGEHFPILASNPNLKINEKQTGGLPNREQKHKQAAEISKSSWSELLGSKEQNKAANLSFFNVDLEDNELKIPFEISKQGYDHWDHALVGYFLDKWNSFHYVKTWAMHKWAEEVEDVVTLENGFYIFNIKNENALRKILDGGPYYCGNRLILLKRWHPGLQLNKEEFSSLPIWVKFYNIPLELWTEEGLSYVASVIGKPLFLDEYTQKRSRLTFARICIEVQIDKIIPKSFNLNLGYGNLYEIKVDIPWKPKRCEECKVYGHSTTSCPSKSKNEAKQARQEWKVKEQKVEEWQEVKGRGKNVQAPSKESKVTPQPISNIFEVLLASQDEEQSRECVKSNQATANEGKNQQNPKGNPKHVQASPSHSLIQNNKHPLDRTHKLNSAKEQALASISFIKEPSPKSSNARKK